MHLRRKKKLFVSHKINFEIKESKEREKESKILIKLKP